MLDLRKNALLFVSASALIVGGCSGVEPSTNGDAERALEQHEFRIARAHLADIFSNGEPDQETYQLQLELMLETGDGHGAMAALDNISDSTISFYERRIARAHALLLQGRAQDAANLYAESDPQNLGAEDFRMVLWAMRALGNDEAFTSGMDTALEEFPDDADINTLAGEYLLAQGLIEEAQTYADTATESDPTNFSSLLLQGQLAIANQELETALELYQNANEIYPTRAAAKANIVGLLLDLDRVADAGTMLEEGLKHHPDDPFMVWQHARYALATDDLDTARLALEKARRTFRSNTDFVLLSAQLEDKVGNVSLAISEYERYLRDVDTDTAVEQRLETLRTMDAG